jgi:antitoxin component HigA of HigAB toxin-antitoxin module
MKRRDRRHVVSADVEVPPAVPRTVLARIDVLRQLLAENDMNASDLASLLEVHASMGSKILNAERSLTIEHIRKLADRFKVSPELFIAQKSES